MSSTDIWVVVERDIRIRIRSISMVIGMIIIPVAYLLFLAVGLDRIVPEMQYRGVSTSYLVYIFPGILAITVLSTSRLCGAILHIEKRSGMLDELLASPLKRNHLLIGKILSNTVLCLIQIICIFTVGYVLASGWITLSYQYILVIPATVLVSSLGLSGLSMILAAKIEAEETFNTWLTLLFWPMMFVSSAFYPVDAMPRFLLPFIRMNPVTYTADILRNMVILGSWSGILEQLGILAVISFILLGLTHYVLTRVVYR
jgi:ABC-2 type transport system permease protein